MRAGRLLALLLVATLALLTGCERGVEVEPPRPSADGAAAGDDAQARRLVTGLQEALVAGDASAVRTLATPAGASALADVVANAQDLDLDRLRLGYVTEEGPVEEAERERYGADAWAGRVALRFGYAGLDRRPASVEARVVFAPGDDGLRIAGFGGGTDTRTPLWLQTRLTVVRQDGAVLALASSESADRYERLLRRAVRQVRDVLPAWDGRVAVEVPADQAQLDAALAAPTGEYDAIAGLATTVAAGERRGGPVRVLLNPTVFDGLSARGAQVVLTHESAHVAAGAPFADMPVWLLEGFADYVALADGAVPVDVAARQVLQRVREQGLPDGLPTAADLEPTAADLAATYEEAWLACRFLAQRHGRDGLVRFYEAVDGGQDPARAFEDVLGTTRREFVAAWRADTAKLAGVAG